MDDRRDVDPSPSSSVDRRAVLAVAVIIGASLTFIVGLALGAPPWLLLLSEGLSLALLVWYLVARPNAAPLPARQPLTWAARPSERVDQLLARFERLAIEELRVLAVRPLDEAAHDAARDDARRAADAAGLGALIDSTDERIADFVDRTMGARSYDPTFAGLAWRHEPTGPADRVRLLRTLSDAALAVAVRDLVDEAVADELLGPVALVVGDAPPGPSAAASA
jgi:hypothetical protein